MALAVQGQEYRMVKRLSNREETRVFLVENDDGHRLVLKCHAHPSLFFDELARYYACDSPYICQILYNHPPFLISGDNFAFHEEIMMAFGEEPRQFANAAEMAESDMSRVGVLVLEWVVGQPLADMLPSLEDDQKIQYLDQLTQAVEMLHGCGEHHGKLMPDNVLVDVNTQSIRLIDLGYTPGVSPWEPGYQSPEHDPSSKRKPGPASDVYMMALNFMSDPIFQNKPYARLIKACLKANPNQRPDIRFIRSALGFQTEKVRRYVLNRSFRWAAVACLVLASVIAITVTRKDSFVEIKDRYISNLEVNPQETVDQLASLREDHLEYGSALTEAIAAAKRTSQSKILRLNNQDISKPIAVVALPQRPMVIGRDSVMELGDWVEIDGKTGYISKISVTGLLVQADGEEVQLPFEPPGFTLNQNFNRPGILVWRHEKNLNRLLESLPPLPGLLGEEASIITRDTAISEIFKGRSLSVSENSLYGFYAVPTFSRFLDELSDQLEIAEVDKSIRVALSPTRLPFHYQFEYLNIQDKTVERLAMLFEQELGFTFETAPEVRDHLLENKKLKNVNWRQVLEEYGLNWELSHQNGVFKITIQP